MRKCCSRGSSFAAAAVAAQAAMARLQAGRLRIPATWLRRRSLSPANASPAIEATSAQAIQSPSPLRFLRPRLRRVLQQVHDDAADMFVGGRIENLLAVA